MYRKPTPTDHYLQFGSHHPLVHKLGVIRTLHYRAETVVSDQREVSSEKDHIRGALEHYGYPNWAFEQAKKSNRDTKGSATISPTSETSKRGTLVTISYCAGLSERVKNTFKSCGISVCFKPVNKLRSRLVHVKDKPPRDKQSNLVYGFKCKGLNCSEAYRDQLLDLVLLKIYTIPIGRIIRKHNISYHMYADDIQLFLSFNPSEHDSIQCALSKLSACITEIKLWMTNNMLKLNDSKTEFFIATSLFNKCKMPPVCLQIGTELIEPSDNVRNLGIIFDSQMSMSLHITGLCKSLSYQLRNISQIRRFLDQDSCHHIVRSLVLSRLDYSNALFLGINQTDLNKLQRLQNWAAKLIFCAKKQNHVTPFLEELHWLPIKDRIHFKIILFVFKCLNNIGPSYLASMLSL